MLKSRQLLIIFIPAIIISSLVLFVRVIQYEPLFPKQENIEKQPAVDFSVPIFGEDPIIGDRRAPATLLVFSDLGCDHCRLQFSLWEQLMAQYPKKVKIIWKSLPVVSFPYSTELANQYAFCTNQQGKFLDFIRLAFTNSADLSPAIVESLAQSADLNQEKLQTCLDSGAAQAYLQKTEQLATLLNIQSVPTVFLNNKQIEPPQILEGWKTLLNL